MPATTWSRLAERHALDYAVLDRRVVSGAALRDVVDADPGWAMVFVDDDAALYVRRAGAMSALADSFGYFVLGGGAARMATVGQRAAADTVLRSAVRRELERAANGSQWNAWAHGLLASLDLVDGRYAESRVHLERALAVTPREAGLHRTLALVALWQQRPRDAVDEFERERKLRGPVAGLELGLGLAWEQIGDLGKARRHYQRELALDPGNTEARARIEGLGRGK